MATWAETPQIQSYIAAHPGKTFVQPTEQLMQQYNPSYFNLSPSAQQSILNYGLADVSGGGFQGLRNVDPARASAARIYDPLAPYQKWVQEQVYNPGYSAIKGPMDILMSALGMGNQSFPGFPNLSNWYGNPGRIKSVYQTPYVTTSGRYETVYPDINSFPADQRESILRQHEAAQSMYTMPGQASPPMSQAQQNKAFVNTVTQIFDQLMPKPGSFAV